ncbi:hypothetical protein PAMP_007461 [Pampus punctatissimus]
MKQLAQRQSEVRGGTSSPIRDSLTVTSCPPQAPPQGNPPVLHIELRSSFRFKEWQVSDVLQEVVKHRTDFREDLKYNSINNILSPCRCLEASTLGLLGMTFHQASDRTFVPSVGRQTCAKRCVCVLAQRVESSHCDENSLWLDYSHNTGTGECVTGVMGAAAALVSCLYPLTSTRPGPGLGWCIQAFRSQWQLHTSDVHCLSSYTRNERK